jgi:hypothetical protein
MVRGFLFLSQVIPFSMMLKRPRPPSKTVSNEAQAVQSYAQAIVGHMGLTMSEYPERLMNQSKTKIGRRE